MGNPANHIYEILPELTDKFPSIEVFYLFGSQAADTASKESDVDVAVFIDEKAYQDNPLLDLEIGLLIEEKLKRRVDVVVLQRVSPILQHQVLAKGIRLFERTPAVRAVKELISFKRYVDAKHYQQKRIRLSHGKY